MTRDEFLNRQFYVSVVAGMNQRFHQDRANYWGWWNRAVQIAVAVLAIASLCIAFAALKFEVLVWVGIGFSVSSAVAAVTLNVLPFGEWSCEHRELFRRWVDLREDIDGLVFEVAGAPNKASVQRLKELDAKVHRIGGAESALTQREQAIWDRCEADERRSRPDCAPVRHHAIAS